MVALRKLPIIVVTWRCLRKLILRWLSDWSWGNVILSRRRESRASWTQVRVGWSLKSVILAISQADFHLSSIYEIVMSRVREMVDEVFNSLCEIQREILSDHHQEREDRQRWLTKGSPCILTMAALRRNQEMIWLFSHHKELKVLTRHRRYDFLGKEGLVSGAERDDRKLTDR
jgi:hypothetical protein